MKSLKDGLVGLRVYIAQLTCLFFSQRIKVGFQYTAYPLFLLNKGLFSQFISMRTCSRNTAACAGLYSCTDTWFCFPLAMHITMCGWVTHTPTLLQENCSQACCEWLPPYDVTVYPYCCRTFISTRGFGLFTVTVVRAFHSSQPAALQRRLRHGL